VTIYTVAMSMLEAYGASVGLVLDIVGAILVWRCGLPPPIRRGGVSYLMFEQADEAMKEQAARYDRLAHLGVSLLVLGFSLQLVGGLLR